MPPLSRRRRNRSSKSLPPKKSSRLQRPDTAPQPDRTSHSSRNRSISPNLPSSSTVSPAPESETTLEPQPSPPSPRPQSPIAPLKVAHIIVKPEKTVIEMVPPSFEPDSKTDEKDDEENEEEEEEEETNIIYPEGVTDFRPYKTVARFRKALLQSTDLRLQTLGKSTNFREHPLLVGDDSAETLVLGLESFAEQHECKLSFTDENQGFDKSIYRAACGLADLGSIHLLATDSMLTANFQFEIDLDYDNDITQSKKTIEDFVLDFCEAISKVLSCDNSNVRVFSIDKLTEEVGNSQVNFGLTTPNPKRTEQLAQDLQTRARSGFSTEKILKRVKPGAYNFTWKQVLTHLQVLPDALDPAHNFDYRKPGVPKEDTRGGYPYYLPIGWYRHALKVSDKYEGGQTWLGRVNAEGEWPVAFHGTNSGAVGGIIKQGLLPSAAKRDVVMEEAIEQMGEEANQPGLYVATHCNGGSYPRYTTPFTVTTFPDKSERFCIVFQCRVEPKKFSTHGGPVTEGKAWRTVYPNTIRPYGILIKKED